MSAVLVSTDHDDIEMREAKTHFSNLASMKGLFISEADVVVNVFSIRFIGQLIGQLSLDSPFQNKSGLRLRNN